tara:strand:- start:196 stop:759 length:564 start_codon:yes stop_codon:yes gene_type:complete
MAIAINGSSNTITGLAVGGLPDGVVDTDMLAANAVTAAKRGSGAILQVKQVVKTDSFSTSSESSVDVTGLSVAITPTSSSSKILVIFSGYGSVNNANFGLRVFLMRGISGTFTEIARNYNQEPTIQSQTGSNLINQFLDSPSTTNEVTYKLQINTDNSGNSGRIGAGGNNGSLNLPDSVITVIEVAV